jgi:hypothetical protein
MAVTFYGWDVRIDSDVTTVPSLVFRFALATILFLAVSDPVIGGEPWRVRLYSLVTTDAAQEVSNVLTDYNLRDKIPSRFITHATQTRNDGTPPDSPGLWGWADFASPSGELITVGLRTFDSADQFHETRRARLKGRPDNPSISVTRDRVSIIAGNQSPPPRPADPGIPHVVTVCRDYHAAFKDGVCVYGDTEVVFSIPIESLLDDVKVAEGKDFYYRFDAEQIPELLREGFLHEFTVAGAVNAQGRDGESAATAALRRAAYDDSLVLLKSVLFDIEECVAWSDSIDNAGAQRGHAHVRAREDSRLAEMIASVRSRSPQFELSRDHKDVATLSVSASLPEVGRALLVRLLHDYGLPETGAGELLAEQISNGYVEFHAALNESAKQQPILVGGLLAESLPNDAAAVAQRLSANLREDGTADWLANLTPGGAKLGPHQFLARANDGLLNFAVCQAETELAADRLKAPEPPGHRGLEPFVQLKVDLNSWAGRDELAETTLFLQKLEQAWETQLMSPGSGLFGNLPADKLPKFHSFTGHLKPGGDWAAEATLRSDDLSLVAEWRLGRDFRRWALARSLLANGTVFQRVEELNGKPVTTGLK